MAASLNEILRTLQVKIERLAVLNSNLKKENQRLATEVSDLRDKLADMQRQRDDALQDCEYLTMSYKLAEDPDKIISGRRHISQLIRNIDKCIRLIKDDPEI